MIAMSVQGSLHFLVCLQLKSTDWPPRRRPRPSHLLQSSVQIREDSCSQIRGLRCLSYHPGVSQVTSGPWCSCFQQVLRTPATADGLALPLIGPACLLSLPGCRARGTRLLVTT